LPIKLREYPAGGGYTIKNYMNREENYKNGFY